jgi:nicotinate-nucleotide adenylyltransferase
VRIGLFGGTFNPIHWGHLKAIEEVRAHYALEWVYLIPSLTPPHKGSTQLAAAHHRLAMVQLAVATSTGLRASDVELKRRGTSYTIDTVRHFKRTAQPDDELFFIMGIDAFLEVDTWKAHTDLLANQTTIVMSRPGYQLDTGSLETFLASHVALDYHWDAAQRRFVHPRLPDIWMIAVEPVPISSSQIRALLQSGCAIRGLVPAAVENYIMHEGLYR